jgi:hypothetical protein
MDNAAQVSAAQAAARMIRFDIRNEPFYGWFYRAPRRGFAGVIFLKNERRSRSHETFAPASAGDEPCIGPQPI